MLPIVPSFSCRNWTRAFRFGVEFGERGEAAEGVLPLIIAFGLVVIVAWLVISYMQSTDREAQEYAEKTMQRLLIAHDAGYLAANLSEHARPGYPIDQQRLIMAYLTSMGTPTEPIKLIPKEAESSKYPVANFSSRVTYPKIQAYFSLTIIRPNGRWQIDFLSFNWEQVSRSTPASL